MAPNPLIEADALQEIADINDAQSAKFCLRCRLDKPRAEFPADKRNADGLFTYCRSCKAEYRREWLRHNPERVRGYKRTYRDDGRTHHDYVQRTYNITGAEYNAMLAAQGGCCAICEIPRCDVKTNFAVDHDHATGQLRGLLCFACNVAIGKFRDNPEVVERAAAYLRQHVGTDCKRVGRVSV